MDGLIPWQRVSADKDNHHLMIKYALVMLGFSVTRRHGRGVKGGCGMVSRNRTAKMADGFPRPPLISLAAFRSRRHSERQFRVLVVIVVRSITATPLR